MKKKTYQINIPEPCNEDWNKMTPQEQGRFCGKCAKVIVDYTLQPDRAIAKALKENNGQICGRFRSDQLQRDLIFEPQFYQNTRWKAFGLMISGLLAAGTLKGQDSPNSVYPILNEVVNSDLVVSKQDKEGKEVVLISGQLIDKGNKYALIGATIMLKGTDIGAVANVNGNFELEFIANETDLLNGITLECIYLGYDTLEVNIPSENLKDSIDLGIIQLTEDISNMEELIIVAGGVSIITREYYEDETLYQLLKNKIRTIRENITERKNTKEAAKKEEVYIVDKSRKDAEKSIAISPMPEIKEEIISSKIIQKAYPNPFSNEITIELQVEKAQTLHLVVFNELGQEIQRKEVETVTGFNQFTIYIDEQKYPSGTYLLSLLNGKEVLQTEVILKK